jgi:dihydroorotase, multifunctional complex type
MKTLIKNGRVLDPAHQIDANLDVLAVDGKIAQIAAGIELPDAETIDAGGLLVVPGLIDIHVHLRDPGYEYKEDIVSGTRAAAAGGFAAVACMPNTNPINDNKAVTTYIRQKAAAEGQVRVYPVGSITKGLKGESLAEFGDLQAAGCVAVSDDGRPVTSGEIMRRALEYARSFQLPVISHAEDLSLVGDGVMNEGFVATQLGLRGIPWVAEDAAVARDVLLAEFTGARLHIAHVSTRGAVEIIRAAQRRGVPVTAETAPHYFTLTDEAVRGYDTHAKMNPPLRGAADVQAIRDGLADGTLSVIATDHAPHHVDEKNVEFNLALNWDCRFGNGPAPDSASGGRGRADPYGGHRPVDHRSGQGPRLARRHPGSGSGRGYHPRRSDLQVDPRPGSTSLPQQEHPLWGLAAERAAALTMVDGRVVYQR